MTHLAAIREAATEVRAYLATRRREWDGWLWYACLAASFLLIAYIVLPAPVRPWLFVAIGLATCAGLAAWALELRGRLVVAVNQAETFADALAVERVHAESLISELAHADKTLHTLAGQNVRLRGDVLDLRTRLSDAVNEAAHAPAPVIPMVPPQRDGSEYEWPRLARQIQTDDMTALMRATEEG